MYLRFIPTLFAFGLSLVAISAQEQDRATIQLRDGAKVEGRIEELGKGTLFLRVTTDDQRRIPIGNIALIDRKGGAAGLPETEVREARSNDHLLLLTGGSSVKGQLIQIRGGEGSSDAGPRTYVFRTSAGEDRSYSADQVARIYLGTYPFEATVRETAPAAVAPGVPAAPVFVPAGAIRVPASSSWVATGLTVRQGEVVLFDSTGEVQLSDNAEDRARPAGTTRLARFAPIPDASAGALIGRIGGNGRPFGIGDQASVPMPGAGLLYLAVNDDERGDNAGEFIVVARRR